MRANVAVSLVCVVSLAVLSGFGTVKTGPLNPPGIDVPDSPREASTVVDSTGKCYVVFTGISRDLPRSFVYFMTVAPDGAVSQAPQAVTPPGSGSPSLVQAPNALHLSWLEMLEKRKFRVGYRRSLDRGGNWTEPVYVDIGRSSRKPLLLQGPGGVLLLLLIETEAGQPERLWCRRSSDEGATWQSVSPQGEAAGAASDAFPLTDSSGIELAWAERRLDGVSIMFNRSMDGGTTWMPKPIAVVRSSRQLVAAPQLIRSADALVMFWIQQTDDGKKLFLSSSSDDGSSWRPPSEIDVQGVSQVTYQVLGDGHNAHVVTVEQKGAGRYRTFDLTVRRLDLRALSSEKGGVVNTEKVWSNSYLFEPDCRALIRGQVLLTAAVVRSSINSWSLILLSSDRFSNSTDIVQIAPDAGGRSRSLMAVAGLPDTVGVFYREQPARRLPMGVLPGDLLFARVTVSNPR